MGVRALPAGADTRMMAMYDAFSDDYDRFVNWSDRLAAEMSFIERELSSVGASRVLDAACGTGMHAIALAQLRYVVVGADFSAGMVQRARANAIAADVALEFEVAGFGSLTARLATGFDAVLCLGNSLPHLLTPGELAEALDDFAACLRPGGLLLIQNRNFDVVMSSRDRWMGPQAYRDAERERLFVRFYDFEGDGTLTFNILTLSRAESGAWEQHVAATRLRPLVQDELVLALGRAGFGEVACYGDMSARPFYPETSGNLVVTARS